MASTRRSRPPVDPVRGPAAANAAARGKPGRDRQPPQGVAEPVARAIAAALASWKAVFADADSGEGVLRVAIGLSGGCDSIVLLDALASCVHDDPAVALQAVHVHHGLSTNADTWADFCRAQCALRGIPLSVHRVTVARERGESLEAAARNARFTAFARTDAEVIALAHHADDQAETLLLQLLRGAGPKGLAAMPAFRNTAGRPALARPFLALRHASIVDYARARELEWIDDESNADIDIRRNFLRHEIAPRLAQAFPGYPGTLVRAASHQAEAALIADALATQDARGAIAEDPRLGTTLSREALVVLAREMPYRARNLLRWFLLRQGLRAPSAARLSAMLDQLANAASDARVELVHEGVVVGIHRGRIGVHARPVAPFALPWHGETAFALPHGMLEFAPVRGAGLAAAALGSGAVTIRSRAGGERIRLDKDRSARSLKRLLQDAGVPTWQRHDLPLVWCDDVLAAVPGLGVATMFRADSGAAGFELRWYPDPDHLP